MRQDKLATGASHRPARILALVLLCLFCLPGISASVDQISFDSFIERHANGWIDWDKGLIYGIGRGYLSKNNNNRPLSRGVGGVLASGSIVKLASGIHLDDARTLEALGSKSVTIKLEAFLKDKPYKSTFVDDGKDPYYEEIKVASMKGVSGLTAKLLDHLAAVPSWQDFPVRALEPQAELADDDQPWLVLDARGLANNDQVQPAMFPKITSETGEIIYELSAVEEAALLNRGMMRYVVSAEPATTLHSDKQGIEGLLARSRILFGVDEARAGTIEKSLAVPGFPVRQKNKRKKRERYIVKDVKAVQGLAKTNLVVSAEDAANLKEEDAASKILQRCRVLVIVASPIGGIEGTLPTRLAMNAGTM